MTGVGEGLGRPRVPKAPPAIPFHPIISMATPSQATAHSTGPRLRGGLVSKVTSSHVGTPISIVNYTSLLVICSL